MKTLLRKEKFARLKLIRSESIGVRLFWRLIKKYSSAIESLKAIGSRSSKYKICEDSVVEREIENTRILGAEFLFFEDELYPPLLREIIDAPPVLTFLGCKEKLAEFNKRVLISIVGARNSSIVANKFCRQVVSDLGYNNIVIVSGMARGIDSESHKSSISTGTIAVLASGIDIIYPPENKKLYEDIKEKGIIFAESPLGTTPQGHLFPKRNRIIAGLSSGTVIIEAAKQSGSLITAKYALEYNRDVFVVPGFPLDIKSEGGNNLLKQGAILTLSSQDILDHIFPKKMIQEELLFDNPKVESEIRNEEIHEKILNLLSFTPITIDELVSALGVSPQEVLPVLMELEIENKVTRLSGQRVSLIRN